MNRLRKWIKAIWTEASKVEKFVMVLVVFGVMWLFMPGDPKEPEAPKHEPGWTKPAKTKPAQPVEPARIQPPEPTKAQPAVTRQGGELLGFSQTVEEFVEDYNLMLSALGLDKPLSVERELDHGPFFTVTLRTRRMGLNSVTVTLKGERNSRELEHVSCYLTEGENAQENARHWHVIAALVLALEDHPASVQITDAIYKTVESIGLHTVSPNRTKVTRRNNIEYTFSEGPEYNPTVLDAQPVGSKTDSPQLSDLSTPETRAARAELVQFFDESRTETFPFTSAMFIERFNLAMRKLDYPDRLHEFERVRGTIVGMRLAINGRPADGMFDLTVFELPSGRVGKIICYLETKGSDSHRIMAVAMAAENPRMEFEDRVKLLQQLDPYGLYTDDRGTTTIRGRILFGYAKPSGIMPATLIAEPL